MRKGYLLIELLVVLFIFTLLTVTFGRLWRTFIFEIPRDYRLIQQSSVLNDAVSHIRADVASARTLSEFTGSLTGPVCLLVKLPDCEVMYEFQDGRISRQRVGNIHDSIAWSAPHGKIDWRVWKRNNTGYAVEITTYIEDNDLGHKQRKMSNSFLFFTGAVWETAK